MRKKKTTDIIKRYHHKNTQHRQSILHGSESRVMRDDEEDTWSLLCENQLYTDSFLSPGKDTVNQYTKSGSSLERFSVGVESNQAIILVLVLVLLRFEIG